MRNFYDYESLGYVSFRGHKPPILEVYSGTNIVRWYGKIEGQLKSFLDDAEKTRNFPYADKLRQYLKIWRENEITGSINRETLDTLKAASDLLAVDTWNMSSYFRSLRDELRVLVASEEELPRGADMDQNDPYAGMGGGGRGGPPMAPDFGPQGEAPGGAGGPAGGIPEVELGGAPEEGLPPPNEVAGEEPEVPAEEPSAEGEEGEEGGEEQLVEL